MILQIGDKVRIKSAREIKKTLSNGTLNGCTFPDRMQKYCGTIAVIRGTTPDGNFTVKDNPHAWVEKWLDREINFLSDNLFTLE